MISYSTYLILIEFIRSVRNQKMKGKLPPTAGYKTYIERTWDIQKTFRTSSEPLMYVPFTGLVTFTEEILNEKLHFFCSA